MYPEFLYKLEFNILLMLLIGYLFGSIPTAYLYCKAKGVDIFKVGSGNPGSTNVGRVLGKKHGRIVFVLDILKAIIPIFIAHIVLIKLNYARNSIGFTSAWIKHLTIPLEAVRNHSLRDPFVIFVTGLGAILGHNFPFTTKFKGGKGIACTVAVIAYFNVVFAVVLYVIHKLIVKTTGYVSLASILTLVLMFIFSVVMSIFRLYPFNFRSAYAVLPEIFIIMVLGIVRHKENIERLERGTENKTL